MEYWIVIIFIALFVVALKDKIGGVIRSPNRPGTFTVRGVDQKTQADTSELIEAASAANAKAKGELRGMIVTSVERARRW